MEVIDLHEPNVEELNSKKRNCTKDADRISNLPDAIIHHILSFLCIIDVVRTSMLARRWRYLWTESSNLIVDDVLVDSQDKFSNMLNSVQKMYKSLNIGRCTLSVRKPCNAKSVNAWVHVAVQRNVKELHVNALTVKPLEVPCCRALKELKLDLHERLLVLPNSGFFRALESLSLSRVQGLSIHKEVLEGLPTQPHNLKHLKLLVGHDIHVFHGISHLLESCTNLEVLRISVNDEETEEIINEKFQGSFFFNNWEFMDYRRAPLNHLLKVYILGFRGTESEIEFVQVLFEYAVVLESMIILFSDEALPTQEMKSEIKQKLAKIKVTSPADITYIDQVFN